MKHDNMHVCIRGGRKGRGDWHGSLCLLVVWELYMWAELRPMELGCLLPVEPGWLLYCPYHPPTASWFF